MNESRESATTPSLPRHVFISYSRQDTAFVETLVADLRKHGQPVWYDKQLVPGTPNWDNTLRKALNAAYAVLFIATPNSAQSDAVQAELELAQSRGAAACPIIPIWAAGTVWADCAPLSIMRTQYIDLRADAYPSGIARLVEVLDQRASAVLPNRLPIKLGDEVPAGYDSVALDSSSWDSPGIAVRFPAYASLQRLLDDLYVSHLRDRFPPHTYGERWLLAYVYDSKSQFGRLIAPWEWYPDTSAHQSISRLWPQWIQRSLEDCGMVHETGTASRYDPWNQGYAIMPLHPGGAFVGIAGDDATALRDGERFLRSVQSRLYTSPDMNVLLEREASYFPFAGSAKIVAPASVTPSAYPAHAIYRVETYPDQATAITIASA